MSFMESFRNTSPFSEALHDRRNRVEGASRTSKIDRRDAPSEIETKSEELKVSCSTRDKVPSVHFENRSSLISIIKSCGEEKNIWKARNIHAELLKKDLIVKDGYIATALLSAYAKCGCLQESKEVFDGLPVRSVVSWTALIAGYAQSGFGEEALKCFKMMQDDGVFPNIQTYICSLKACSIAQSLDTGEAIDAEITRQGLLHESIILGNALVQMYAKCGALEKAQGVFAILPHRNVVSWTTLIAGYTQHGCGDEALKCFRQMRDEGICPDSVLYTCVLKACEITRSLDIGKDIDGEVRKQGLLQKDITLGNALIEMYVKCDSLQNAQVVFEQLPVRDAMTWTLLIAGYVQQGYRNEAMTCLRQMHENGFCPDAIHFVSILKACDTIESLRVGELIRSRIELQGLLQKDITLGNSLVGMYTKCGVLMKAQELFELLQVRDVVTWTTMITGYIKHGRADEALKCFRQMQDEGIMPDAITYICILKACSKTGSFEIVEHIYEEVGKQDYLKENILLGNVLVDTYATFGELKKAKRIFEWLPIRNVMSWTALISGYAQHGFSDKALKCIRQMEDQGVTPSTVTYIHILDAVESLDLVEEIYIQVRMRGLLESDITVANALIDKYAKFGAVEKAKEIFEQLPLKNVVTWTTLISGYALHGLGDEALECFKWMQNMRVHPNVVTYICVLKACGIVGALEIGEIIHSEAEKQGPSENDIMLRNALVDMYAKCGAIQKAHRIFEQLPARDVVSWTALMTGYSQTGQASKVLDLFSKMIGEGTEPNAVTFLVLLTACNHAGLLEEGQMLFDAMSVTYHLTPTSDHYACLIDLLSRAGNLNKAKLLLDKVLCLDHLPFFLAILSACCKWFDVQLGRWAFEQSIRLDDKCTAAYTSYMESLHAAAST